MKRFMSDKLKEWKDSEKRKPALLRGPRYVGKTWLMKELGKKFFSNTVYINFEDNDKATGLFAKEKKPDALFSKLIQLSGENCDPEKTLVIFDEIQACPSVIYLLEYIYSEKNEYHVISATSAYSALDSMISVSDTKIDIFNVSSMSFDEYLIEVDPAMFIMKYSAAKYKDFIDVKHQRCMKHYRDYLVVGGLPDCVNAWCTFHDVSMIQNLQSKCINDYERDIINYNDINDSSLIFKVFNNFAGQLGVANGTFKTELIDSTSTRKETYYKAINWLVMSGFLKILYGVTDVKLPLETYIDKSLFKLSFFDTGLYRSIIKADPAAVLAGNDYPESTAMIRNYVMQQMFSADDIVPRFYRYRKAEINYVFSIDDQIVPVELRLSDEIRSSTVYTSYIEENDPFDFARISDLEYTVEKNGQTNVPLYSVSNIISILDQNQPEDDLPTSRRFYEGAGKYESRFDYLGTPDYM